MIIIKVTKGMFIIIIMEFCWKGFAMKFSENNFGFCILDGKKFFAYV